MMSSEAFNMIKARVIFSRSTMSDLIVSIRYIGALLAISTLSFFCSAAQAQGLPGVDYVEGQGISPTEALTYYGTPASPAAKPASTRDPRVKDLARALDYDIDLIYEHIRDSVEFTQYFGLKKGARGAVLDFDGSALDQSQLMVEMLRESDVITGTNYNPSYQTGIVEFNSTNGTLQDATSWIGSTNAHQVCRILRDGGIPAEVNGEKICNNVSSTLVSIRILHSWVSASISGQTYVFDPSFKPYSETAGVDLDSAMNFSQSSFDTAANIQSAPFIGSVSAVISIDSDQVFNELSDYTAALAQSIRAQPQQLSIRELIGSRSITRSTGSAPRNTSLPYATTGAAALVWNGEVPDVFRTKVVLSVIHVGSFNWTRFADEIYGSIIRIQRTSNVVGTPDTFEILQDGFLKTTGQVNEVSAASTGQITIYIDHPYAAQSGSFADELIGKRLSENINHVLLLGFGHTSDNLTQVIENDKVGTEGNEGVLNVEENDKDSYGLIVRWLSSSAKLAALFERINDNVIIQHHSAGLVSRPKGSISPAGFFSQAKLIIDVDSSFSFNAADGNIPRQAASRNVFAPMLAGLEGNAGLGNLDFTYLMGSTLVETDNNGCPGCGSTAITTAPRLIEVDASNWSTVRPTIQSNINALLGMSGVFVRDTNLAALTQIDFNVQAGYTVLVPDRPLVQGEAFGLPGNIDFACFPSCVYDLPYFVTSPQAKHAAGFVGIRKGLENTTAPELVAKTIDDFIQDAQSNGIWNDKQVSLATGEFSFSQEDMRTGSGEFPYSLPFISTYSSSLNRAVKAESVRGGFDNWTHNYHFDANLADDLNIALGGRGALDAAAVITAIHIATSTHTAHTDANGTILALLVELWAMERTEKNVASIKTGVGGSERFTILPAGGSQCEYVGSPTSNLRLELTTPGVVCQLTHFNRIPDNPNIDPPGLSSIQMIDGQGVKYIFPTFSVNNPPPAFGTSRPVPSMQIIYPTGVTVDLVRDYPDFVQHGKFSGHTANAMTVTNSLGRSLRIKRSNDYIALNGGGPAITDFALNPNPSITVTDDTGRTVEYRFDTKSTQPINQFNTKSTTREITSRVDVLGQVTLYAYDTQKPHLLTKVTTPSGIDAIQIAYDYDTRTKSLTNANGNSWQYLIAGSRSTVKDPLGFFTATYFDTYGDQIETINERGDRTEIQFDDFGRSIDTRIRTASQPLGHYVTRTTNSYDARSNVIEFRQYPGTDSNGTPYDVLDPIQYPPLVTQRTYDPTFNVLLTETSPLGVVTTTNTINAKGQITRSLGPSGEQADFTYLANGLLNQATQILTPVENLVTQFSYDGFGNIISATADPAGLDLTRVFGYDTVGNVISATDPRGNTVSSTYNSKREFLTYRDPTGGGLDYLYDLEGRLTHLKQLAEGGVFRVTQFEYTQTGKVSRTIDPDLNTTSNMYDSRDLLDTTTDADGLTTQQIYHPDGKVAQVIKGVGTPLQQVEVSYTYAFDGSITRLRPARGNFAGTSTYDTTYAKDAYGRTDKTTFADGSYEQQVFRADGLVTEKLLRSSFAAATPTEAHKLVFGYDLSSRIISQLERFGDTNVNDRGEVRFEYDLAGRIIREYELSDLTPGANEDVSYSYNRVGLVLSETSSGRSVSYTYDSAGNRTGITWPDNVLATYTYDALNRLDLVMFAGQQIADYNYDLQSRLSSSNLGNGTSAVYGYDSLSRLASLNYVLSDESGNAESLAWSHGYSAAGRLNLTELRDASQAEWSPAAPGLISYSAPSLPGETANVLDQYEAMTSSSGTDVFSHDGRGNLVSMVGGPAGNRTYSYDFQNRLIAADVNGMQIAYDYDVKGRRVGKEVSGQVTRFLHASGMEIAEYDGTTGTLLRRYVPGGAIDNRVIYIEGSGTDPASFQYYHADRLGNVAALTNSTGNVSERYAYDPFGNETSGTSTSGQLFRYTGRKFDPETGLYFYRSRYYCPYCGRFLSTDTIGYDDQYNLYTYVSNNPLNSSDPNGQEGQDGNCLASRKRFSGFCGFFHSKLNNQTPIIREDTEDTNQPTSNDEPEESKQIPDSEIEWEEVSSDDGFLGGMSDENFNFVAGDTVRIVAQSQVKIGVDGIYIYVDSYQLRSPDDRVGSPNIGRPGPGVATIGGVIGLGHSVRRIVTVQTTPYGNRWRVVQNQPSISGNQGHIAVTVFVPKGDLR